MTKVYELYHCKYQGEVVYIGQGSRGRHRHCNSGISHVFELNEIYFTEGKEVMKASEFIIHLQQMIEEHGDLPLALMEFNMNNQNYTFIEVDGIDSTIELQPNEVLFDSNDEVSSERKVFLID